MRRAAIGLEPLATNPTVDDLVPHRAFHTALYVASHNDVLIATLEALWDKTDRYRRLGLEAIRSKEELDQPHLFPRSTCSVVGCLAANRDARLHRRERREAANNGAPVPPRKRI